MPLQHLKSANLLLLSNAGELNTNTGALSLHEAEDATRQIRLPLIGNLLRLLSFPTSPTPPAGRACLLYLIRFRFSVAVATATKQFGWFGRKPALNLFKHVPPFRCTAARTSTQLPKSKPISRVRTPPTTQVSGFVAPPPPPFGWRPFLLLL